MSKIKKSDLFQLVQEQAEMIAELSGMVELNKMSIIKLENEREKPQLKQLDQSVFDGLDEKWRFAAVNVSGALILSTHRIEAMSGSWVRKRNLGKLINYGFGYDTSNWQNSLIERDIAKELTGSDLAATMNDFKDGDLVFELDFACGIKLANLKKAGRLASEDYDFQTRYGFNYLKDGRAYPIFSVPHLIHATTENRKALVTLYGEKAVPQLPSEAGL